MLFEIENIKSLEIDIIYPIEKPKSIMPVGSILVREEIMTTLFLIGLIHDISAPDIIAINDKIIIGLLIFFSSLIIIQGVEFIGEIIVAIENRIE